MKRVDRTGHVYGKLTVLGQEGHRGDRITWRCRCACGTETVVIASHLQTGHTTTCGCLVKTHGMEGTPEYRSYASAKARCSNPNDKDYYKYGARGIEFRFKSFIDFYKELGDRPVDKKSVDRIDVNGHYELGNVRWATAKEQCRNQRRNIRFEFEGKSLTAGEWEEITGIKRTTIERRIKDYGWCIACSLTNRKRQYCTHRNL